MSTPSSNKMSYTWPLAGLLVLVIFAVYGRVCNHEFLVWDDYEHVVDNRMVNPPSSGGLASIWRRPYWGLYIPLSYTFFSAESAIARRPMAEGTGSEANPAVFHLGNLALHIGCVLLVFALLRRLFGHDWAAFGGALLFGLHPMQAESVAWISETRGVLCAFFSLLAIFDYVRWSIPISPSRDCRDSCGANNGPPPPAPSSAKYYVSATLALLAALLCKPVAVAVPLLTGVLAIGLLRQRPGRAAAALGPWFALSLVFVVLTKYLQPSENITAVAPFWARPLLAGDALAFYLYKLVAPLWLIADYGRTPDWVMSQWTFYLAWLVPVVLVVGLSFLKDRRIWLVCLGLFACWLLPVLGFVPFNYQRISTVADRYVYLSMLGPALALGWYFSRPRPRAAVVIAGLVLCLLAGLSFHQVSRWRDNRALLDHILAVNPRSVVGQQLSGHLLAKQGKHEEAVDWYRRALPDYPRQGTLHLNLAISLAQLGRDDEALAAAWEGVRQLPRHPLMHCQLAILLAERGQIDKAIERHETALELDPDCGPAHLALGKLLQDRGKPGEAAAHYRSAIEDNPYFVQAYINLGTVLEQQDKLDEAADCYRAALAIEPHWASAHYNLGNIAMMRPGGLDQAVGHYRAALKSANNHVPAHLNLAYALSLQGNLDEARDHYREVLRLVPADSPYAKRATEALRGGR